jgi:DUF4097 and DUF4098 domain-containing protein YvlB
MNYVSGKDIGINTKNSIIDIKNIKVENLNAVTANGRIVVENVQNYENSSEINLGFRTKNGEIKANINDMENRGYKIKAQNSNGGINLLIPELLYTTPGKQYNYSKNIEAETSNYNSAPQKVNINAETANGYIEIVK